MKRRYHILVMAMLFCAFFTLPVLAEESQEPNLDADARQAAASDPPVIPHMVSEAMSGEQCLSCHRTGVKKAPVTSHPERLGCTQCHVQGEVKKDSSKKGKK